MDISVFFSPISHKEELAEHDMHEPCAVQVVHVLLKLMLTLLILRITTKYDNSNDNNNNDDNQHQDNNNKDNRNSRNITVKVIMKWQTKINVNKQV